MKQATYTTASQSTLDVVIPTLKGFKAQLRDLLVDGRYGLATELKAEARDIVEAAIAYCENLADEIGADTQLGCCGTPANWVREFNRDMMRVA